MLFTFLPIAEAEDTNSGVEWKGWWVDGVKVDVACVRGSVTAKWGGESAVCLLAIIWYV